MGTDENKFFGDRLYGYWNVIKKLKKIHKEYAIDITISFLTTVNVFNIISAKWSGIPCIISERNNPVVNPPRGVWKILKLLTYRYASLLVVQTMANKAYHSKYLNEKSIEIVPNPLASELIGLRDRKKNSKKQILTVGRLDKNKSQDLLLRAFSNIRIKEDWQVILVGDGDQMKNYCSLAAELRIENKIKFEGKQHDISRYYNEASIFVFTSKSEGFPNVLIEALHFGLPIVSTNCPNGPSELIDHGKNGFLIPIDNQPELEEKLKLLINDSSLRADFSQAAIESASKFTPNQVKRLWQKHLESLLMQN